MPGVAAAIHFAVYYQPHSHIIILLGVSTKGIDFF